MSKVPGFEDLISHVWQTERRMIFSRRLKQVSTLDHIWLNRKLRTSDERDHLRGFTGVSLEMNFLSKTTRQCQFSTNDQGTVLHIRRRKCQYSSTCAPEREHLCVSGSELLDSAVVCWKWKTCPFCRHKKTESFVHVNNILEASHFVSWLKATSLSCCAKMALLPNLAAVLVLSHLKIRRWRWANNCLFGVQGHFHFTKPKRRSRWWELQKGGIVFKEEKLFACQKPNLRADPVNQTACDYSSSKLHPNRDCDLNRERKPWFSPFQWHLSRDKREAELAFFSSVPFCWNLGVAEWSSIYVSSHTQRRTPKRWNQTDVLSNFANTFVFQMHFGVDICDTCSGNYSVGWWRDNWTLRFSSRLTESTAVGAWPSCLFQI